MTITATAVNATSVAERKREREEYIKWILIANMYKNPTTIINS